MKLTRTLLHAALPEVEFTLSLISKNPGDLHNPKLIIKACERAQEYLHHAKAELQMRKRWRDADRLEEMRRTWPPREPGGASGYPWDQVVLGAAR